MIKNLFKYIILIILFDIILSLHLNAQERGLILSKHYSAKEYGGGNQNWAIIQDQRGILYFGNARGILEYDGESWRLIQVSNKSNVRSLVIDNQNVLYAGAYNELGYLKPDVTGNLVYNSLTHLIDSSHLEFGEIWDLNCFSDSVFFLTDRYLIRYVNGKFDYWESQNGRFYLSHKINNSYYVQEMGKGLLEFKNDSLVLVPGGDYFSDIRIHSILKYDDKYIICTRNNGFYIYQNSGKRATIKSFDEISPKTKNLNKYFIKNIYYHGIEISDRLYAFSSIFGNILIVDHNWNVVDNINEDVIGITSSVFYLFHQKNHSLWLALANGISQVEILSPYRYWNDECGINGSFTDIAEINDNLYVSTGSGIFYTNKNPDQTNYSLNRFHPVSGTFEQSWGFLYFQPPIGSSNKIISNGLTNKNTILLAYTGTGLFQIINHSSVQISKHKSIYKSYQYRKDPSKLLLGLNNGLAMLNYNKGKWTDLGTKYGIHDMIRSIGEDSIGNIWLSAGYKGLIRVKNPFHLNPDSIKVEYYDTSNGLPSVQSIQLFPYKNHTIFKSNGEYYVFNDSGQLFYPLIFPEGTTEKSQPPDTLSDYRIYEDAFTGYYVTSDKDTNLWFGSANGVFRYIGPPKKDFFDIPSAEIRNVSVGDSIIYNGTNFLKSDSSYLLNTSPIVDIGTALSYNNNSLTFYYAFPYYENEEKNEYSFFLEGYDKAWSEWNKENKKEYTNLPEGDYIFKVKAKNLYQIESTVAEFKFSILPPWYRTFSAFFGYIIIGILLIVLIVKLYTKRLIKEKDKLEKIVIERTQEILMQKEEILVQAEHLKDANEGKTAKNEELEKQKWEITNQAIKLRKANLELIKLSKVASETDNAIAIFNKDGNIEWINDGFTRMYGYTLEQYKKEKNSNIIEGSGNPKIEEAVISCIQNKKSVVYKFKTKTRKGKEIWIQTTLTHIVDKDGETLNLIAIDSDITELKLAEKEIEEQRDKLAISNATKNKFFRIIAHDLRNPISTLAGSTSLIFNDFNEYNKEQTKNFIGELNKLSQTTYNLLENLLDWSSTQMGDISFYPKPIDLLNISKENIELIKRKIDQKKIKLNLQIDNNTFAFADENMIKTIIRNLISNAVKFTPDKGEINIKTEITKDFINYSISDSGIGIKEQDLQKLFKIDQHFTTPGLGNEKGSGLGLILCKEFVEKNGGEISISSHPNQGTSIKFSLRRFQE